MRDIRKNDYVILENDYVGKRKITCNSNPSWCPRMKEADSTPRRTRSTLATDCTPLLLSTKVRHNKLATIILRLWEEVARRKYGGSIEFLLMVFAPRIIHAPLLNITKWTSIIIIIEAYRM